MSDRRSKSWVNGRRSRTPDQNSHGEDQAASHDHLYGGGNNWHIHITMANPADDGQFDHYDGYRGRKGNVKIADKKRQCVPQASERRHGSCDNSPEQRLAAAGERAVVGKRFGKRHGDSGTERSGEAHEKSVPGFVGRERRRKNRRQSRDRTIHQAREPGLHDLQHEQALLRCVFFLASARCGLFFFDGFGGGVMLALDFREVAQKFASGSIGNLLQSALVKAFCFQFHDLGLLAHLVDTERADEPFRAALDETFYVLAPNQRDVIAETLLIKVNQALAMTGLFGLHVLEHFRGGGVGVAQAFGEVAVDAGVFFFELDSEREDFPLAEVFEPLLGHDSCSSRPEWTRRLYPKRSENQSECVPRLVVFKCEHESGVGRRATKRRLCGMSFQA